MSFHMICASHCEPCIPSPNRPTLCNWDGFSPFSIVVSSCQTHTHTHIFCTHSLYNFVPVATNEIMCNLLTNWSTKSIILEAGCYIHCTSRAVISFACDAISFTIFRPCSLELNLNNGIVIVCADSKFIQVVGMNWLSLCVCVSSILVTSVQGCMYAQTKWKSYSEQAHSHQTKQSALAWLGLAGLLVTNRM